MLRKLFVAFLFACLCYSYAAPTPQSQDQAIERRRGIIEQLWQDIIKLREEKRILQQDIAAIRAEATNTVITLKITVSPRTTVTVEQE